MADRKENGALTEIYNHKTKTFEETQWKDISVGDILRIKDGKPFPADLILLSSSEPQGICYIETSNLDGETNLKIKSASTVTGDVGDNVDGLKGELQCEQPNRKLYEFNGNIKIENDGNDKPSPLNPNSLLLRGAKLMNTPWICGNFFVNFVIQTLERTITGLASWILDWLVRFNDFFLNCMVVEMLTNLYQFSFPVCKS